MDLEDYLLVFVTPCLSVAFTTGIGFSYNIYLYV